MKRLLTRLLLMASLVLLTAGAANEVRLDSLLKQEIASLPELTNRDLDAKDFQNRKVVVTFFASWCPPCREEFKELGQLATRPDSPLIIAINVFEDWFGDNSDRRQQFLTAEDPSFPVIEGNAEIREAFDNVDRIPTLYIF